MEQGNASDAVAALTALQQQLLADARDGTIAPAFMRQVLTSIDTIADSHDLALPFSVTPR